MKAGMISTGNMSRALVILLTVACSTSPVPDYEAFYALAPFTVVVLPVVNETADADAPRYFISTIAKPLVDRGYYVLPVQATADILAAEGLGDGGALRDVDPRRFQEYFGADAVLRVTLQSWDTVYLLLASSVTVAMRYELISTTSGQTLWETNYHQTIQSNSGGGGLGGLIASAINAAITASATDYVPMAYTVNVAACDTLPPGPYHHRFDEVRKMHLERARLARERAAARQD